MTAGVDVLYGDELDGRQVCIISQQSAAEEAAKVVSWPYPNTKKQRETRRTQGRNRHMTATVTKWPQALFVSYLSVSLIMQPRFTFCPVFPC